MRLAFFSPLPPAPSGIADYSAALVEALRPLAEIETFCRVDQPFDPARFDAVVYQVGNNGAHGFVYQTALRHPGIVALHEANLHHLVADLTIARGDWDAYVAECEYNGGPAARALAERVRQLEIGPDYELKMIRRLLESARAVVVHSRFMEQEVRAAGFSGFVAVIPHGAWLAEADRNAYRRKLGLDEAAPLAGIFGFLKPYKRIPEALRAFRRLTAVIPEAKLILAGEPHPDRPLEPLIRSLGLSACVRQLGFTAPQDFTGYMAACDVVINLRYPTVGESSGTLQRALGLGKPSLVSEIGAFRELPDDVCLKVPIGAGEEDAIFEYLNLLLSRRDVAAALGARAREYAARECDWPVVARQYVQFVQDLAGGLGQIRGQGPGARGQGSGPAAGSAVAEHELKNQTAQSPQNACLASQAPLPGPRPPAPGPQSAPSPQYLRTWATNEESRRYLETHETRLLKTLEMIPPGGPDDRILEMGAYLQITPALRSRLGYGEVRGCYYGEPGRIDRRMAVSTTGESFECEIDHFDAERDAFPYPDGHFSTVLCCELIEHLAEDPMRLMREANRVLKPGGSLLLTTPNAASLRAIAAILQGHHPGFYPAYVRPQWGGPSDLPCQNGARDIEPEARHNREYTPREIRMLLANSGFEILRLETGEFRDLPHPEHAWVRHMLERYRLETDLRGDGIYALGRKTGPIRERYPEWLYS